ncbi:hypothetical protein LEP1GSC124_3106, partial [Leptospira interrogans serovar Pyrogenes str. 200701872]
VFYLFVNLKTFGIKCLDSFALSFKIKTKELVVRTSKTVF